MLLPGLPSRELLLPKAFPVPEQALLGSRRRWQQERFREMYILINEGALDLLFCSLFLAVGDSLFPSWQPDVEQRDAGVGGVIYL